MTNRSWTPTTTVGVASYPVPDTPVAVTCTITNTRTSAVLTLQKTWVNGAAGDTAALAVSGSGPATSGSATSTATGAAGSETDTVNRATATVFSGQTVNLAETLGAGNTGSYTSQIACDQTGLTPDGDGQGGSYLVPGTPVAVTCTITNTRTSATLILQKTWVNGAAGDTADLGRQRLGPGDVRVGHVHRDRRRGVGDRHRQPGHRDDLLRADGEPRRDAGRRQHRDLHLADHL